MSRVTKESPVRLEQLDDHLKVILKFRIREFVHLSPCFRDIPSIDATSYPSYAPQAPAGRHPVEDGCPNRLHRAQPRPRYVRHAVV